MRIVVIQRKLVRALCALPAGSTVDRAWLSRVAWPRVDANWVRRFWENHPDSTRHGRRQAWLNTIAAADSQAKQELLDVMAEQHRFRGLYHEPPTQRVQQTDRAFWAATSVRKAMRCLMLDFYDPWFYESAGYPSPLHGGTDLLKRSHFACDPLLPVCPFSDGTMQRPQLDHFLSKEAFPFICLHPDNLIPSGSDANTIKSITLPLSWTAPDQAGQWFHPRWRSARNRFRLRFDEQPDHSLILGFEAADAAEQHRVANLDAMFRLAEFWGRTLNDDIQKVQKEVADALRYTHTQGTADNARTQIRLLQHQHAQHIGDRPLHIYYAALYQFVLNTEALIVDLLTQYHEDVAA